MIISRTPFRVSFFGGGSMGDFATKGQTFGIRAVRGGF